LVEAGGDNMKVYIKEGWTNKNWCTDVDKEIKRLTKNIQKKYNKKMTNRQLQEYYEDKKNLGWLQEFSKMSIPTLIIALEDLYMEDE